MKSMVASLFSGVLFAIGLAVSGMTRPSKVVGFLDLFGDWDASLAVVIIGAIAVHVAAHRLITRRRSPIFDVRFHLPPRREIDGRLVVGAAVFGVGWALGGFCPGPGLVTAASGGAEALVFVVGMTAGTMIEHAIARRVARRNA
jgi:uncharacterized protein